ncbi:MAG: hypothetical protein UR87_C0009G0012 [candidate division CPR3 bacterium GW2011_GWE2_35_7]|nr:MAG: hypothetical protein UR87_C0009G0012 [candidate division CPR3 bacterium GW2011_GWE2_35_7]
MKTTGIAMWSYTKQPDTKFDPCWRVTLLLSDAEAKKLKGIGLKVKRNDDDVYEYKFKRNVDKKKGKEVIGKNPPPRVVDAGKNTFDGIIGNGSIVNVQFAPYAWEYKGKKGLSADLQAIQIVDLVAYAGGTGGDPNADEFDVVDGTDEFSDETETEDNDDDNGEF